MPGNLLLLTRPRPIVEAQDLRDRIHAAGSSVNYPALMIASDLIKQLKISGCWEYIYDCSGFLGNSLNGALIKFKTIPSITNGWTLDSVNYTGPEYTETGGFDPILPNTSRYLNTKLKPSDHLDVTSVHLSVYAGPQTTYAESAELSSSTSGNSTPALNLYARFGLSNPVAIFDSYTAGGSGRISVANTETQGLTMGNRTSNSASALLKNAQTLATINTTGGSRPTSELLVGVKSTNALPQSGRYSNMRQMWYSIGLGMPAAQVKGLFDAVELYQRRLGRVA